jgi:hypothetical protein
MGEWNRGGDEARRYGAGRDRSRSFDFESDWVDPEHGGYTGESFGRPDVAPQDRGGRDVRGQPYPRPEDADAREGFDRYGVRGEKDYRGEVYRTRDVDQGRRETASGYGREGGVVGVNPALDRVADDETGYGWRETFGRGPGPHRGRGPKTYVRSDARIREDVNERLSEDSWLDASGIEVEVQAAEVTLSGVACSREDKRHAEDLAWEVGGVKHVQNNLRVQSGGAAADPAAAQDRPA